ncbi:hypothetical protein D5S17_35710 [Pseudonocardiaceae bacterium YIM PH 21723]|nr:hypothetical protein D5S17_35710 [Pseudonocardiaceae bacterium YIM PH 21723]
MPTLYLPPRFGTNWQVLVTQQVTTVLKVEIAHLDLLLQHDAPTEYSVFMKAIETHALALIAAGRAVGLGTRPESWVSSWEQVGSTAAQVAEDRRVREMREGTT